MSNHSLRLAAEMVHVLFTDLVGYSLDSIEEQTRLRRELPAWHHRAATTASTTIISPTNHRSLKDRSRRGGAPATTPNCGTCSTISARRIGIGRHLTESLLTRCRPIGQTS